MKHVVALSGGKDSTAMALRLKELYPDRKYEYVLTPTGDELPEMKAHWKKLKALLGNLHKINQISLFDLMAKDNMIPNWRIRSCTRVLKIEPFIDYMQTLSKGSVMYVGLRHDEDGRLGLLHPDDKFSISYPMKEWKWTINDVTTYLKNKGITIPDRTDCGCCFFQRLPEWKTLLEKYPERYEYYIKIEEKYGHTFRSPGRDTWPADLESLKKEIQSGRKMRNTKPRGTKKCRFCSM